MDFQQSYLRSLAARLAGASAAALMDQTTRDGAQADFRAAIQALLGRVTSLNEGDPGGRVEALERALRACRAPIEAGALAAVDPSARAEVDELLGSMARTVGRLSRRPRAVAPPVDGEPIGRRQRHGQRRYKPAI
jgi:hypothetical protein